MSYARADVSYVTLKTIVWWLYVHEKSIKISGQDGIAWREEKWGVKHYCHCLFEGKIYTKCNFSACSIQYCSLYSTAVDLIEFSRSDISQCSNQLFLILHPVRLRGIQYITRFDSLVSNISWSQTPRFLTHHEVWLRIVSNTPRSPAPRCPWLHTTTCRNLASAAQNGGYLYKLQKSKPFTKLDYDVNQRLCVGLIRP